MEEEIKDFSKRLNTTTRQNESMTDDLNLTKKKFIEF